MNFIKKIVIIVLLVVSLTGFASCKGNEKNDNLELNSFNDSIG